VTGQGERQGERQLDGWRPQVLLPFGSKPSRSTGFDTRSHPDPAAERILSGGNGTAGEEAATAMMTRYARFEMPGCRELQLRLRLRLKLGKLRLGAKLGVDDGAREVARESLAWRGVEFGRVGVGLGWFGSVWCGSFLLAATVEHH
jgi:hypothetical protein